MRPALTRVLCALALVASAAEARCQSIFFAVEPNDTKAQATPAFDMRAGDRLRLVTGTSSGPNIFRIRHAAAPLGIYRHELSRVVLAKILNSSSFSLLGRLARHDIVEPQSLANVQATTDFLSWYGFGKSEELFVDLRASVSGRFPFGIDAPLATTQVTEVDLGVVNGPSLWFSAQSVGGAQDLELHVFDSELNALPRASVDQSIYHPTDPWLHFNVAPGVYHIAVADHATASHLPPGPHDLRVPTTVLDFAGAALCGSTATGFDVEVAVRSDQSGPALVSAVATKTQVFEVLWFRVQVGAGQATATFCPGDGTGGTCACYGAAPLNSGMGCVNSTGRGATAIASDHSAAPGPRPWRITLEDLPASTLALSFLTLQTNTATPILAGLHCIGAGAVRVGPLQADPAGTAVFDGYLPSSSGFLVGQSVHMQAAYRDFFAPSGCQLNFTSGFSFVVR